MFPHEIKAADNRLKSRAFARMGLTLLQAGKDSPREIAEKNHVTDDIAQAVSYPGGLPALNVILRSSQPVMTSTATDSAALAAYKLLSGAFVASL
jgi:hypothetical protein